MQTQSNDVVLLVIATSVILLLLLAFIAVLLFAYQKKNILYYKELEDVKNIYDKNLLETQLEMQEQTFQDISREIHDNIGLSLTLAKLQLNTINYSEENKIVENIGSSVDLISKALLDLSDVSKSLNSELIKNNGLYNTLRNETDKICRSGKYNIEFTEEGNIVFLSAHKELILFRIAQEALNNILKHAQANEITIVLRYDTCHISLLVEDNGIGFNKAEIEKPGSVKLNNGLTNMRTRTALLGGTLSIESSAGKGTRISITSPY